VIDEIAEKRSWLGPLYPFKLHQMGEPMLHPDLPGDRGLRREPRVPFERNTNCGLITQERIDALYRAGLTNLILSYQTPDAESFRTRKAPRLAFEDTRDKVRLAVERKVVLRAEPNIESTLMNTNTWKVPDRQRRLAGDRARLDWIAFCQELERRHGLTPRRHDLRGRSAASASSTGDEDSGR